MSPGGVTIGRKERGWIDVAAIPPSLGFASKRVHAVRDLTFESVEVRTAQHIRCPLKQIRLEERPVSFPEMPIAATHKAGDTSHLP